MEKLITGLLFSIIGILICFIDLIFFAIINHINKKDKQKCKN
ncbi:MAG: hypothetical protein V1901_04070 [Patescibacteria group bacterium]